MKFLIIFISLCFGLSVYGQSSDPIIEIFNKYEQRDGVQSVSISPSLLRMIQGGRMSDPKTADLISKITGLRIISLTDGAAAQVRASRESLMNELKVVVNNNFTEFMSVVSSGTRVELYVRNSSNCQDCKNSLLMVTTTANSATVMHLAGTIDQSLIDAVMKGEIGFSK
jgi:hypothetical protein